MVTVDVHQRTSVIGGEQVRSVGKLHNMAFGVRVRTRKGALSDFRGCGKNLGPGRTGGAKAQIFVGPRFQRG